MSDLVWVAVITSAAPTLAVLVTYLKQRKKIEQVHGLVNDRLDSALKKIAELEKVLRERGASGG